jgi:FOG: FHA domain
MQCPSCKETIDDDSRYCDQCGEQILVCSVCGRPGKGKRCIFDGKELVPASGAASAAQPIPQSNSASGGTISGDKVKLASQLHGIMIEVQDGDIIGKNGPFAGVFSRFNYVSRTHCKIVKTAAGWHIQDMGSTNGTACNGTPLVPNTLYPLTNGATVKIADVELTVTYDTAGGGTTRI